MPTDQPGMSSTPPQSGVGFGIGTERGILSVRSASDRDGWRLLSWSTTRGRYHKAASLWTWTI